MSNKRLGFAMMVLAPTVLVVYAVGFLLVSSLIIDGTVILGVLVVLGLMGWIGYTIFTEPPAPDSNPGELDSLEPETILPLKKTAVGPPKARSLVSGLSVIKDCEIGDGTEVRDQANLFKCRIGKNCKIESFVYIEEGVTVGDNCKIKPNVFIPTGVKIGDNVFIGPNTTFTNDKHPKVSGDWKLLQTRVMDGASIGAHAVILPGLVIGSNSVVGAGSVVTRDVGDGVVVAGNPARAINRVMMSVD